MSNHLSVDIETFSSVDIKKTGLYRYVQAPDFQILLFAYSWNGSPVQIVDLAQGEQLTSEILFALQDPNTIKKAYNAAFEWYCLNKFYYSPLWQWRCTQLHGLYCGYPMGLGKIGEAMGAREDKRKMGMGMALIRTFCVPCKPTAKNGHRTRTLPHHEPEKWQLFKQYCKQDVVSEMEADRRLSAFPVPEQEQRLWELDQQINACGVAVDTELVDAALHCDEVVSRELMTEAIRLSGLSNPKSVKQLSKWLTDETGEEITDLQKGTVKELIKTVDSETARRMLEIRQEISKTSTKKYVAMRETVCRDGRIRGLLQFYGANRTGRWAGRLVQVQNLPRNYLETLSHARECVKAKKMEVLKVVYGNVPDTLSQIIRTVFVPAPGNVLLVSDFSAIEARVIAWLAGEQWRLEVFATHGKIYEASASQMFGVPIGLIKKGNPEYELRQKGKVAELACIAAGQQILTDKGLCRIEKITTDMLVWDGIEFVKHDGVVYRGIQEVMTYEGLTATPDHLVWIEGEPEPVRFDESASSGAHLLRSGNGGSGIWLGEDYQFAETLEEKLERSDGFNPMQELRSCSMDKSLQPEIREVKRLSTMLSTKTDTQMAGPEIHGGKTKMHKPARCGLSKLRRAWNSFLLRFGTRSRAMDANELRPARKRNGDRPDRSERELRAGKSPLGNTPSELRQSAPVYDILNCGPRNRFTVSNCLVHNCGYQGGVGALKAMGADQMGLSDEDLLGIIKRWRGANKRIVDLWYSLENAALEVMRTGQPVGIKGLILARESDYNNGQDFLTITLPSRRKLFYVKPFLQTNERGREALHYWGMNQTTKKWEVVSTYGGKITENCVQGIARDCLAESIKRLAALGYQVVMHVHDEVVLDVPEDQADLKTVCSIMGQPLPWAPDLQLRADGFITKFYKKD